MSAPENNRPLRRHALALAAALLAQPSAIALPSLAELKADGQALSAAATAKSAAAAQQPAEQPASKSAQAHVTAQPPAGSPAKPPPVAIASAAKRHEQVVAPAPSSEFFYRAGEAADAHRVAAPPAATSPRPSLKQLSTPTTPASAHTALAAAPVALPQRRPDRSVQYRAIPSAEAVDPNAATGIPKLAPQEVRSPTIGAPVPDRWRLVNDLGLLKENPLDPYNQNTLKGDKPIRGDDEFLILSAIADSIWEPRRVPTPVSPQSTTRPGSVDIFGGSTQNVLATSIIVPIIYLKGDTAFKPPDYELHFTPAFNFNHVQVEENRALRISPGESRTRRETFIGVQELFADYHLRNVSDRYDFDSIRVGIQPISLDFRGFLFQDLPMSVRLFGTRDNNYWQYNILWARRLEKDTNSLLNSINQKLRDDDVFAVNLFRQDWPVVGFTTQGIVAHNVNREGQEVYYNRNGFIERPGSFGLEKGRNYQVTYLGLNGDGHFGRTNLTAAAYLAVGRESRGAFIDRPREVFAGFAAAEASWDFDWTRLRVSGLYASGDPDPFDDTANGYDAINELPLIAGADTSYHIRQSIPLIGGGGVALTTRNGVLNNLRTSIQHGQSNFANPGTVILGVGTDFDLSPTFRLSTNVNHVRFADSTVLEVARNQGNISEELGWDVSVASIWRPFMTQNIVIRVSYAEMLPGKGFKQLFPDQRGYSMLANLVFTY